MQVEKWCVSPSVVDEAAVLDGLASGQHRGAGGLPGVRAAGDNLTLVGVTVQALQVLARVVLVEGAAARQLL